MKRLIYLLLLLSLELGCFGSSGRGNEDNVEQTSYSEEEENTEYSEDADEAEEEEDEEESEYSDGTYCADIDYYNSNTGTNSSYTLTVEIESNELTQINWPNGGWLDNDHFDASELDEDGFTSFTSDKGYDYEVQITGEAAGCFINFPDLQQCNGITEDGEQCERMTDNSNGYCWQHQDQE